MKKINIVILIAVLAVVGFGFNKGGAPEIGLGIGNKAPELMFNTPDGKALSLAAVNKKTIVLIDFWASWCGPCRMENPNVVRAYNKYKDAKFKGAKGFTVYGVSLDQNMDSWKAAIAKDGLIWPNHVSDLGGWRSKPAQMYAVNSIPTNYLIDANGVIVGIGLRGPALEAALEQLMEK